MEAFQTKAWLMSFKEILNSELEKDEIVSCQVAEYPMIQNNRVVDNAVAAS